MNRLPDYYPGFENVIKLAIERERERIRKETIRGTRRLINYYPGFEDFIRTTMDQRRLTLEESYELLDGLANSSPMINPKEPNCRCDPSEMQPASQCRYCKYSQFLQRWREHWDLWIYANPNSWQSQWLKKMREKRNVL